MRIALFILIFIFSIVFFLMAISNGNNKNDEAEKTGLWCFACIFSMLMGTILCLVS